MVPIVHLMLHSDPKDRIHKEDLQEEALAASLSSQAELNEEIQKLLLAITGI